jgi:methyltransferase family protein
VLEIGTWCGKSAAVLACGVRDGSNGAKVVSVDVNVNRLHQARAELAQRDLAAHVTLVSGTADAFLNAADGFEPMLVFVDGDHTLRGVLRDLAALEAHVPRDAVLVFHDYAGTSNEYEVEQAVSRSWVPRDCEFGGVFGLSGVFVRTDGRPRSSPQPPLLLDAVRYDTPALRLKQRIPPELRERVHVAYRRLSRRA